MLRYIIQNIHSLLIVAVAEIIHRRIKMLCLCILPCGPPTLIPSEATKASEASEASKRILPIGSALIIAPVIITIS